MEKDPTYQSHDNCPNCGFELDLSPPASEQVAQDLGSAALKGGELRMETTKKSIKRAAAKKRQSRDWVPTSSRSGSAIVSSSVIVMAQPLPRLSPALEPKNK